MLSDLNGLRIGDSPFRKGVTDDAVYHLPGRSVNDQTKSRGPWFPAPVSSFSRLRHTLVQRVEPPKLLSTSASVSNRSQIDRSLVTTRS